MDEFQNRMEISYTIYAPVFLEGVSTTEYYSEAYIIVHSPSTPSTTLTDGEGFLYVEFQNRMEISYTIYAFMCLEGVSITETKSEAYIIVIVHGYAPSTTLTDGEGFLRVEEFHLHLSGISSTASDSEGELRVVDVLYLEGTSETFTDSEGHITEIKFLSGRSVTKSDGTGELFILPKPDLMKYLPAYYEKSKIMKAIQDAYSTEFGYIYFFFEDFLKQFLTPATATWGLAFWEQELGLKTDTSKTYEERREIILSRLRGMGAVGKDVIKRAAEAFSGGEVEVVEYPEEHRFVVRFVGTREVPKNMASFIEMIEDLKPAHLTYNFMYTYTWWYKLKEITWAQAGMGTWNDLRVYG